MRTKFQIAARTHTEGGWYVNVNAAFVVLSSLNSGLTLNSSGLRAEASHTRADRPSPCFDVTDANAKRNKKRNNAGYGMED